MPQSVRRVHTVLPAQVSFVTIYNPSLGNSDETLHEQILYYHSSKENDAKRRRHADGGSSEVSHEEQNERLRQIGLAQGMVEFTKAFSDGSTLDAIESEKSRILLHELEIGWWILASIDLTRFESVPDGENSHLKEGKRESAVEYSSREICPPSLLLQHLLRAHSIFLLHHAPSLAQLYTRLTRLKFCGALERFWNKFLLDWDVLLSGNPAVDIHNGLKLAAGGELGIGVGEEEWGSGEREVLEGFVSRTEGLVDLIVSRFGDSPGKIDAISDTSTRNSSTVDLENKRIWLGAGRVPRPADGVIFSGIGAVTRPSVRDLSAWMEWIYKYGRNAYGVADNPHSARRKKKNAIAPKASTDQRRSVRSTGHPENDIPRSIVTLSRDPSIAAGTSKSAAQEGEIVEAAKYVLSHEEESPPATETLIKYLTLGVYGSSWGIPSKRAQVHRQVSEHHVQQSGRDVDSKSIGKIPIQQIESKAMNDTNTRSEPANGDEANGSFLIGLQGNLENEDQDPVDDEGNGTDTGTDRELGSGKVEWNSRLLLRTLHVKRSKWKKSDTNSSISSRETQVTDSFDRFRVIVYVHRPFIFTFLFELQTDSLSMSSSYRSLHHQLGPLQRPLLASTSPLKVSERLYNAGTPTSTTAVSTSQPIYDLVYDPANLTVHTTIPVIPEPGTTAAEGLGPLESHWTRIEALNVHSQILSTHISTRQHVSELERTCKTNRGWWVVWMRLPQGSLAQQSEFRPTDDSDYREAFLVRKASDYVTPTIRKASGIFSRDSGGSSGWAGPAKLAEGIGIDTRRYIESLLSLNR